MYKVVIKGRDGKALIVVETDERPLARAWKRLAEVSEVTVDVTQAVPASDRVVKFKGVD